MSELKKHTIDFLKVLADQTRLEILDLLNNNEKSSSDIQVALDKSQSTISQHLKILINNNLVTFDKKENIKYYKIKNKNIFNLLTDINSFVANLNKEKLKNLRDLDIIDTLS